MSTYFYLFNYNFQMIFSRYHFLFALFLVLIVRNQVLVPSTFCLGNCTTCDQFNLAKCILPNPCDNNFYSQNADAICLHAPSTQLVSNQLPQTTTKPQSTLYKAWGQSRKSTSCEYASSQGKKYIQILGLYTGVQVLERVFEVDPLSDYFQLTFDLVLTEWLPFNDFLIVDIVSQNENLYSLEISFEEVVAVESQAAVITCNGTRVMTKKYGLKFVNNNKVNNQITVTFTSFLLSSVWGFTNIRLQQGCLGYSLFNSKTEKCSKCDADSFAVSKPTADWCQKCPLLCKTCESVKKCLTCVQGATVNSSGLCDFGDKFKTQVAQLGDNLTVCDGQLKMVSNSSKVALSVLKNDDDLTYDQVQLGFVVYYSPSGWKAATKSYISVKLNKVEVMKLDNRNFTNSGVNRCSSFKDKRAAKIEIFSNTIPHNVSTATIEFELVGSQKGLQFGVGLVRVKSIIKPKPVPVVIPPAQTKPIVNPVAPPVVVPEANKSAASNSSVPAAPKNTTTPNVTNNSTNSTQPAQNGTSPSKTNNTANTTANNTTQPNKSTTSNATTPVQPPKNTTTPTEPPKNTTNNATQPIKNATTNTTQAPKNITEVPKNTTNITQPLKNTTNNASQAPKPTTSNTTNTTNNSTQAKNQTKNQTNPTVINIPITIVQNQTKIPSSPPSNSSNSSSPTQNPSTPVDPTPHPPQTDNPDKPAIQPPTIEEEKAIQNIIITEESSNISFISSTNNQQSGLQIYIDGEIPSSKVTYTIFIDKLDSSSYRLNSFMIQDGKISIFIQIDQSFTNGSIAIYSLTTSRLLTQNTPQLVARFRVERFDSLTSNQIMSMQSFTYVFTVMAWLALALIFIAILLGYGVTVQQFVISLQVIFLHVYIASQYLPLTFRDVIGGLNIIQSLNFFAPAHKQSLQSWMGNSSKNIPVRFYLYNSEIYFLQEFYPIIIINVIYLIWFGCVYYAGKRINEELIDEEKRVHHRAIDNIANRVINFFDQIWRYQFLSTIWFCFIQFYDISSPDKGTVINALICFFAFVCSIAWPVFVTYYCRKQYYQLEYSEYLHFYEDLYYGKIPQYELPSTHHRIGYPLFRGIKLFLMALMFCYFGSYPIFALVSLIIIQAAELIYAKVQDIYVDKRYLILRVIENALFIVLELVITVMLACDRIVSSNVYKAMGYFLSGLALLIVLNSAVRVCYLGRKKYRQMVINDYDLDFEEKKPKTQRKV